MVGPDATQQKKRFGDAAVADHPEWMGKTVGDMRREHEQLVIAIKREGAYLSKPLPEEIIQADDILILLGSAL